MKTLQFVTKLTILNTPREKAPTLLALSTIFTT